MNNYLNGDDMWPYVTMWEYEERIIPLQKIVDIFHESGNQKLKCYILTSPLDEERFNVLKAHDDLDFHWVESLDNQDSNNLVGLFSFKELDSADRLDEVYFGDSEAYSAAGKTWFGWWLVEHYFSYHVNRPDGCGLGEPTRGR